MGVDDSASTSASDATCRRQLGQGWRGRMSGMTLTIHMHVMIRALRARIGATDMQDIRDSAVTTCAFPY